MKQFSLKAYLEHPDRKVVTKNGRNVRIICTNRLDENYPVIALVSNEDSEDLFSYTRAGKLYKNQSDDRDLFFAGEKTEELANACALVVRYKDKINTKTVETDAQKFLDNCSYTGIAGYGKHK